MLRIEQIEDKEALKQAAVLLDRENQRLHKRNLELTEENARLKGHDASTAQRELVYLQELLASRERALFGDKPERRVRGDEQAEAPAPAPQARTGRGPKPQA